MPRPSIVELNAARMADWRKRLRRWTPAKAATMMSLLFYNEDTEYTVAELAEILEVDAKLVLRYIRAMRLLRGTRPGNQKVVYVANWKNARTLKSPLWVEIFAIGSKPDVKRPPKRTKVEWNEARRERYHRNKRKPTQAVLTTAWSTAGAQEGE